jgi:hypothetical protein
MKGVRIRSARNDSDAELELPNEIGARLAASQKAGLIHAFAAFAFIVFLLVVVISHFSSRLYTAGSDLAAALDWARRSNVLDGLHLRRYARPLAHARLIRSAVPHFCSHPEISATRPLRLSPTEIFANIDSTILVLLR